MGAVELGRPEFSPLGGQVFSPLWTSISSSAKLNRNVYLMGSLEGFNTIMKIKGPAQFLSKES